MKLLTQHVRGSFVFSPSERLSFELHGPTDYFRLFPKTRYAEPAWGWYFEIWWLYGVFRVQRLVATWDRNKERNRVMRQLKKLRRKAERRGAA